MEKTGCEWFILFGICFQWILHRSVADFTDSREGLSRRVGSSRALRVPPEEERDWSFVDQTLNSPPNVKPIKSRPSRNHFRISLCLSVKSLFASRHALPYACVCTLATNETYVLAEAKKKDPGIMSYLMYNTMFNLSVFLALEEKFFLLAF